MARMASGEAQPLSDGTCSPSKRVVSSIVSSSRTRMAPSTVSPGVDGHSSEAVYTILSPSGENRAPHG